MCFKKILYSARRGQSLMEVLLAMVLGTIMVLAAVAVIAPVVRSGTNVSRIQVSATLGKELLENVRVLAESDWHTLSALTPGPANHYHVSTTTSPFTVLPGDEFIVLATTTSARYFYVEDVGRDADGHIVASNGTNDPSTKKVTVSFSEPQTATSTIETYLTRSRTRVARQTDWSGGPGAPGPVTAFGASFASSTNISFATTTGSITVGL